MFDPDDGGGMGGGDDIASMFASLTQPQSNTPAPQQMMPDPATAYAGYTPVQGTTNALSQQVTPGSVTGDPGQQQPNMFMRMFHGMLNGINNNINSQQQQDGGNNKWLQQGMGQVMGKMTGKQPAQSQPVQNNQEALLRGMKWLFGKLKGKNTGTTPDSTDTASNIDFGLGGE